MKDETEAQALLKIVKLLRESNGFMDGVCYLKRQLECEGAQDPPTWARIKEVMNEAERRALERCVDAITISNQIGRLMLEDPVGAIM